MAGERNCRPVGMLFYRSRTVPLLLRMRRNQGQYEIRDWATHDHHFHSLIPCVDMPQPRVLARKTLPVLIARCLVLGRVARIFPTTLVLS